MDEHASRHGRRRYLWVGAAAAAVVAVSAAAVAVSLSGSHVTPHVLVIPSQLGAFERKPSLEQELNVKQLQQEVISRSAGQASHVVSAVYENGSVPGSGSSQIMLFIGGNLSGVSPAAFVASFTTQFRGAHPANPGAMGGAAACVNSQASAGGVALCTWADSDTFGVVASPTMSVSQLSAQMGSIRPLVERHP